MPGVPDGKDGSIEISVGIEEIAKLKPSKSKNNDQY